MTPKSYQVNIFKHSTSTKEIKAGGEVFKAGDTHNHMMYVVKSGKLAVKLANQEIDYLVQDDIFGEMALIENLPRSADVVAVEDSVVIAIDEAQFLKAVQSTPYFALQMLKILSARLRASRHA